MQKTAPSHLTLRKYLAHLGVGEYWPILNRNHITLSLLSQLSEADLKEIGITSIGHRRTILSKLAAYTSGASEPISPSIDESKPSVTESNLESPAVKQSMDDDEVDWDRAKPRISIFAAMVICSFILILWATKGSV